jgi:D-inositol-3-phosphate glycosyltransferase
MKILFYATHPQQPIGYARVAYRIANFLAAQPSVEVHYLAISNFPNASIKREIDPRIKMIDALAEEEALGTTELYGMNIIIRELDRIKPDVFFIYNDIIVTCRIINELNKAHGLPTNRQYKTFSYIDLVYPFERPEFIAHLATGTDHIFVFTDYWKQNLIDMGLSSSNISILYHGSDTLQLYDRAESRASLGLQEEDFIILNTNRNAYRKAWDITVAAFVIFLKRNYYNPRLKLFVNCNLDTKEGYKLLSVIQAVCMRYKVDYNTVITLHILQHPTSIGNLEDNIINKLYCATDLGINTCVGEGFGLCNLEHGSLGVAQVVPRVGGLADIFSEGGAILVDPVAELYVPNNLDEHNGYIHICRPEDFAEALDVYYKDHSRRISDGAKAREIIIRKYNWDNILPDFINKLTELTQH